MNQNKLLICCEIVLQIQITNVFTEYILNQNRYRSAAYEEAFRKSIENPEEFWAEVGQCVEWSKPWDKVLDDSESPFTKW